LTLRTTTFGEGAARRTFHGILASIASRFSSTTDHNMAIAEPRTAPKNNTVNRCVTAFPLYYPQARTRRQKKVSKSLKSPMRLHYLRGRAARQGCDRSVDFGDGPD
jgi:hypothetical protein